MLLIKELKRHCRYPVPKKTKSHKHAFEIIVDKDTTQNTSEHDHSKEKLKTWTDRKTKIPGYEDAEYATYITPIILAAKLERQEMIRILLVHNASEIHPLTGKCNNYNKRNLCNNVSNWIKTWSTVS